MRKLREGGTGWGGRDRQAADRKRPRSHNPKLRRPAADMFTGACRRSYGILTLYWPQLSNRESRWVIPSNCLICLLKLTS